MFRKHNGFSAKLLQEYNVLYLKTDSDCISFSNVFDVSNSITRLISEHPNISALILDFESIYKIDSSGIGVLININCTLEKHGQKLHLLNINPHINRIFQTLNIDDFLSFISSIDQVTKK